MRSSRPVSITLKYGIEVRDVNCATSPDFVNLLTLRGAGHSISGTLVGRRSDQRIVEIDEHHFDVPPAEHMLMVKNDDRPGVIGTVGTLLGEFERTVKQKYIRSFARDVAGWIGKDPVAADRLMRSITRGFKLGGAIAQLGLAGVGDPDIVLRIDSDTVRLLLIADLRGGDRNDQPGILVVFKQLRLARRPALHDPDRALGIDRRARRTARNAALRRRQAEGEGIGVA